MGSRRPSSAPRRGRPRRMVRVLLALAALLVSGALAAAAVLHARGAVPGWTQRTTPREPSTPSLQELRTRFDQADQGLNTEDYLQLARYLIEGWAQYRTPDGARAHYPGLPSQAGRAADGLEGFSRILPLAAVLLARGDDPLLSGTGQRRLSEAVREGLIAGSDPEHPAYWGDIRAFQPQFVEAADIALGVWIARQQLWDPLSPAQRERLATWLKAGLSELPHDGNWQVFPIVVHRSLQGLGIDVRRYEARMQTHWERLLHLHRGGGWFLDPPHGVDYYSAWGVHYSIYWLRRMDPAFGGELVPETQAEFASFLRHLIGPQGHPALGRSTCYRMALPAPLLASLHTAPGAIPPGQAIRALDLNWGWFVSHGALEAGTITAGLCRPDPALQPHYSGPASCLWSTRSLVIALDLDRLQPGLLDAPRDPLPAERERFILHHQATGWTVRADPVEARIEIIKPDDPVVATLASVHASADASAQPALRDYHLGHRFGEWILNRPLRPENMPALYRRERYTNQDDLFRGCRTHDRRSD